MYFPQDILQYGIVPMLEPEELVSLSMASRLFREIVDGQVSGSVIKRVNNLLERFFGQNVEKIKQFMNDTGTFLSKEEILQCVLDEYWLTDNKLATESIHFYCAIGCGNSEHEIYDLLYKLIKNWGFDATVSTKKDLYIFRNNKKYAYIYFLQNDNNEGWLDNFKSKYYVQNSIEKVKIEPAYGSIIQKTVKYVKNVSELNISHILKRLKDNGFKIDISLEKLCHMIKGTHLFEVSFIGRGFLDNGSERYNYEYKSGDKWYLNHSHENFDMHMIGNIISFGNNLTLIKHPTWYVCPLDICGCSINHFHNWTYINGNRNEYDFIFLVV